MEKVSQLRNLDTFELESKIKQLQKDLMSLNLQRFSGRLETPHIYKQTKKQIARIKTILNQRKNEQGKGK